MKEKKKVNGSMCSEKTAGVITLPRIKGGVVTRMTVLPINGTICEMNIETSDSNISFPEEIRFDLNARINVQKIVVVGGPDLDHQ